MLATLSVREFPIFGYLEESVSLKDTIIIFHISPRLNLHYLALFFGLLRKSCVEYV